MIARDARITPSLLQKYYPTKESIVEAFVENASSELDRFFTYAQKTTASTADTKLLLSKIALSYVDFVHRMRGFYLTWVTSPELVLEYSPALPDFISGAHQFLANVLVARLGIEPDDALVRVRIFLGAIFAWVVYYNRVGVKAATGESKEKRVERLVSFVLRTGNGATLGN